MDRDLMAFKRTDEDWCPSFSLENNGGLLVQAFLLKMDTEAHEPDRWIVTVCGDDDGGMEYQTGSEVGAQRMFLKVLALERVNLAHLKALGFVASL